MNNNGWTPILSAKQNGIYRAESRLWEALRMKEAKLRPETMGEDYVEYLDRVERLETNEKRTYVLIGFDLANTATKDDVLLFHTECMPRVLNKKWIKDYVFNWEFVNKYDQYSHPHVHLLCTRAGKCKSDILKELWSTCKKYLSSQNNIDVKIITFGSYQKVRDYVCKNRPTDNNFRYSYGLRKNFSRDHPNGEKYDKSDLFDPDNFDPVAFINNNTHIEDDE